MDPIATAAELFTIFKLLLSDKKVVTKLLKELEQQLDVPKSMEFYSLLIFAILAAGLGGILWICCQKVFPALYATPLNVNLDPSLGGSREPHGLAAFLWPVVTFLPSILLYLWFSKKYELLPREKAILVAFVMLVSLAIASWVFYDLPLFGFQGFRSYIMDKGYDYMTTETYLVIIWSAILSSVPFFLIYGLNKRGFISEPGASLITCAYAIVTTIVLTTFCIALFIPFFYFPDSESLRGAIAGIALRVSLFFGLLITSNSSIAKKIVKDIIESFKS